jgi:hypothetical protein
MLMRTVLSIVVILAATAGCEGKEEAAGTGEQEAQPPAKEQPKSDDGTGAKAEPKPADDGSGSSDGKAEAAASDGPTGIAACDEYLDKYERCLQAKVPEEAREAMTEAFQAQRDAWVQSAKAAKGNQEVSAQLAKNCKQAIDAAKVPMEQYGCEW